MKIAIVSALAEEQEGVRNLLENASIERRAGREFVCGHLNGRSVVLAQSGIGKVAAAATTALLIEHFKAESLIFTGVAGGISADVQVGDMVVARHFVQHDMDVRPLFDRWLVPGRASPLFECDPALTSALEQAAQSCVEKAASWQLPLLGGRIPRLHSGLIASGDQFIVAAQSSARLREDFADAGFNLLAVEMEGAAIAQVCADYGIPFAAVRTISDRADDSAHLDFTAFVQGVASRYALEVVGGVIFSLIQMESD